MFVLVRVCECTFVLAEKEWWWRKKGNLRKAHAGSKCIHSSRRTIEPHCHVHIDVCVSACVAACHTNTFFEFIMPTRKGINFHEHLQQFPLVRIYSLYPFLNGFCIATNILRTCKDACTCTHHYSYLPSWNNRTAKKGRPFGNSKKSYLVWVKQNMHCVCVCACLKIEYYAILLVYSPYLTKYHWFKWWRGSAAVM